MLDLASDLGIACRMFLLMSFFIHMAIINSASVQLAENVCLTEECNKTATEILENMDSTALPCNNFYQFACGKFVKNIDIEMKEQISSLIEFYLEETASAKKNKPFQKAFKLYELCKAENATNPQGIIFLRQLIKKIGGWPLVEGDKWNETKWENVVAKLSKLDYNSAIFFDVKMVIFPAHFNVIMMKPSRFELSEGTISKLSQIAIELGANASTTSKKTFKDILSHFEHLNSYPITISRTEVYTIYRMKLKWPSIDWIKYFTEYFSSLSTITIREEQFVYLYEDYVDKIVTVLNGTSNSVIMNYVIANIVEKTLPYLSPEITKKSDINSHEQTEYSSLTWRKHCVKITTRELPRMVHALFYTNYFDDKIQNEFINISNTLLNKANQLISQSKWLDNRTTQIYADTFSSMTHGIWIFGDIPINEYIKEYNHLTLDETSFHDSMWSLMTFQQNTKFPKLINTTAFATSPPLYKNKFNERITDVDGRYIASENKFVISMGAILNPFFRNNCPKYINYGGLGHLLAHDIAYGIAVKEVYENTVTKSNLNETVQNEFKDKIDCFVAQYDNIITKMRMPVNGKMTPEDIMADNIGVKLIYSIYKDWTENNPAEPKLHNLNYSAMQMFWISLVQNQCVYSSKFPIEAQDGVHNPEQFRINGAVSNFREFSEAFQCPPGSPMNPENKCNIW